MPYQVAYQNSFEKDLKGLKKNKPLLNEIKEIVTKVCNNPQIGDELKYNWKDYRCIHFHRKPEMRLMYIIYICCQTSGNYKCDAAQGGLKIEDCSGMIDFIFVKSREEVNNLYARNKQYADGFRRGGDVQK